MTIESTNARSSHGVSRRRLVQGAAWATPAVLIATAAPAFATSTRAINVVSGSVTGNVLKVSLQGPIQAGESVTVTVSLSWSDNDYDGRDKNGAPPAIVSGTSSNWARATYGKTVATFTYTLTGTGTVTSTELQVQFPSAGFKNNEKNTAFITAEVSAISTAGFSAGTAQSGTVTKPAS
ncbi:hypothetical protein [Demequina rhizosphaerae]|uniref:hypothetical protein n=1 Tax=Demequina rhizosphaerae TaxID=1638985 RepID=UPI0007847E47|nr:hypothetical protein [Demequina rhizosphaerae]